MTCLVLVATVFVAIESRAVLGADVPVPLYNASQAITGIRGLNVAGKTYNVSFIYGNLDKAFTGPEGLASTFEMMPDPKAAIDSINQVLNSLDTIPRTLCNNKKQSTLSNLYNRYMIPVELTITQRTYDGKELPAETEINAVYGYFDLTSGRWKSSLDQYNQFNQEALLREGGIIFQFYVYLDQMSVSVYTKFEEVN